MAAPVPAKVAPAPEYGQLSQLLDVLGPTLFEVLCAPRGLDIPVGEPVIFDPIGGAAAEHDLLLAVGVDITSAAALDALDAARLVDASALVVKLPVPAPESLVRAASAANVTLLGVPADAVWAQLLTLLRTARGALMSTDLTADQDVLRVDDLFGLANAIAATLGGATTIEDLHWNVLAYSTLLQPIDGPRQQTILGHRVPPACSRVLEREGTFRRLYASTSVVHVPGGPRPSHDPDEQLRDLRPRLAVAVRAGGQPLGSIWVIEGDQPFTSATERALRSAAQIAAMHMLHHRNGTDLHRRRRIEALHALLTGAGISAAPQLFTSGNPMTVVAFAPQFDTTAGAEADAELIAERVAGLLTLHLDAYRRQAQVATIDNVVYVVWTGPEVLDIARITQLADEHRRFVEQSGKASVHVGIAAPVTEPRELIDCRADADRVLRLLDRRHTSIGHATELRSMLALCELEAAIAADPVLQQGKIAVLATHDAAHGTSHIATLRAYLDCFGDVAAAAAVVHVHRNTFRYRLARLSEVAELDLEDPDERLIAHLQMRALQLPRAGIPPEWIGTVQPNQDSPERSRTD